MKAARRHPRRLLFAAFAALVAACGLVTEPPPASKLAFVVQPVTTAHDQAITPAVAVSVQDAAGKTLTSARHRITLAIRDNPGGGALSGGTTVVASNGVATFPSLHIDQVGAGYTLVAAAAGLTDATSRAFDITAGPAANLAFISQPRVASPGATIAPAVIVAVQDAAGHGVPSASHTITVGIATNPTGAVLSGTTTIAAVNGVATFSTLSIDNSGSGYTLQATAADLVPATSAVFVVRVPLAFFSVSSGYFHSCGMATDGAAYCWGDGSPGQSSPFPVRVSGEVEFTHVSAGRSHSCGLTSSGAAYCWGLGTDGRLGNGSTSNRTTPTAVSGGITFARLVAGYDHSCGVTSAGQAFCWGGNSAGELGNAEAGGIVAVPVAVSGGLTFSDISAGRYFTCGLTLASGAYCWGDNSAGELGNGGTANQSTPTPVSGGFTFAAISAGGFHACAVTSAGAVYCWGRNAEGQVGDGTFTPRSAPASVTGGLTFAAVSAGNRHTCGVTTDGEGYCWGDNANGALGNGATLPSHSPVAVAGGLTFASISAGRFHSCGVTTGGATYCWGGNGSGLLGDGTTSSSSTPVRVR